VTARATTVALVALVASCGGVEADLGLDEPLRIPGGRFVDGPLPGQPAAEGEPLVEPAVTLVDTPNVIVRLGQVGKELAGRTTPDAVAIGVAAGGAGTGYWVSPLGPPDPLANDELTFTLDAAIGWDVPIGPGAIEFVAIDADGHTGRKHRTTVCVRPDLNDNQATCDPTQAPPATVIALSWDASVDLDLVVRTPEGKLVSSAAPTTIAHPPPILPSELSEPGVGILDRDSNANCHIDGINREALVWKTAPTVGTYLVYANLADACGQHAVTFTAVVYQATTNADGTQQLVETARQSGRLIADAADGGIGPGLFLLQLAL